MKRVFAAVLLLSALATSALHSADAVALAAQQEAQDNYKRLTATVEEFQTAQLAQQKQISALASDLSKLRDEVTRNDNNAGTQEAIRKLNEQILKVDESRIADNKRIQEALEQLGKAITELGKVPPPPRRSANVDSGGSSRTSSRLPATSSNAAQEGFEYIIQKGDYLGLIVKRYNDEKIPVTQKSVMDANPTVVWTKLQVGQKIFIPKPK